MIKTLIVIGVTLVFLMVGFSGCIEQDDVIEGTGTIVYNDLEGGFYGITADKPVFNLSTGTLLPITRNLLPMNLSEDFKEEGLRVWFKVQLQPDLASIYMWGIMVEIIEIERLD